jgi:hypothetical protein
VIGESYLPQSVVSSCSQYHSTLTTPKPPCITVEHTSLKLYPPHPDTFHQRPSPCLRDFISPTDSDIIHTSEPLNPTSPLRTLPDQSPSARSLPPTPFFQRYFHLPNKSKSGPNDQCQNNNNLDLENQFHSSAHGVNLRTHIWGEPSNNKNRTMNETRSSSSGKGLFGVRKETNVFIKEELRN